ncbi:hypothetical protein BDZ89DRAFT_1175799 [Hymenopellis radicata]|nr:hypothetical protein BDZ89DRAFT_1175799 [Hymenopellis radicata]
MYDMNYKPCTVHPVIFDLHGGVTVIFCRLDASRFTKPIRSLVLIPSKSRRRAAGSRLGLLRLAYRKLPYFKGHIPEALGEPGVATELSMLKDGEKLFAPSYVIPHFHYQVQKDARREEEREDETVREGKSGLPPPTDDEDGSDGDEEIEDDVEYDSDS